MQRYCTRRNVTFFASISDNQQLVTSYGSDSQVQYFESQNYPSNYPPRGRSLYLLFIPGATSITFTFDSPFGIEVNKDELYIGRGLEFEFSQINGLSDSASDKYFFEGRAVPQSVTIASDAVWMYFLTDKNDNDQLYPGFRVRWSATLPDSTPPVIFGCPSDVVRSIALGLTGSTATWTEPTATDDSGIVNLTLKSHEPGSFFSTGITQVTYVFVDGAGNRATCLFNVVIQFRKFP